MIYSYKCTNKNCEKNQEEVAISKPMSESGTDEFCKECEEKMQKVFGSPGVKTSDGYKA